MVVKTGQLLHLLPGEVDFKSESAKQVIAMLETKLQSVFKDYSTLIFDFPTEKIKEFLKSRYKPRCESVLREDEEALELFEESVESSDFTRFVQAIIKLELHMVLNEPPIELSMLSCEERAKKAEKLDKFEFWMFNKSDYYCIDGFP